MFLVVLVYMVKPVFKAPVVAPPLFVYKIEGVEPVHSSF